MNCKSWVFFQWQIFILMRHLEVLVLIRSWTWFVQTLNYYCKRPSVYCSLLHLLCSNARHSLFNRTIQIICQLEECSREVSQLSFECSSGSGRKKSQVLLWRILTTELVVSSFSCFSLTERCKIYLYFSWIFIICNILRIYACNQFRHSFIHSSPQSVLF